MGKGWFGGRRPDPGLLVPDASRQEAEANIREHMNEGGSVGSDKVVVSGSVTEAKCWQRSSECILPVYFLHGRLYAAQLGLAASFPSRAKPQPEFDSVRHFVFQEDEPFAVLTGQTM